MLALIVEAVDVAMAELIQILLDDTLITQSPARKLLLYLLYLLIVLIRILEFVIVLDRLYNRLKVIRRIVMSSIDIISTIRLSVSRLSVQGRIAFSTEEIINYLKEVIKYKLNVVIVLLLLSISRVTQIPREVVQYSSLYSRSAFVLIDIEVLDKIKIRIIQLISLYRQSLYIFLEYRTPSSLRNTYSLQIELEEVSGSTRGPIVDVNNLTRAIL